MVCRHFVRKWQNISRSENDSRFLVRRMRTALERTGTRGVAGLNLVKAGCFAKEQLSTRLNPKRLILEHFLFLILVLLRRLSLTSRIYCLTAEQKASQQERYDNQSQSKQHQSNGLSQV